MAAPTRFVESIYETWPDDQSTKKVYVQAAGLTYTGIGDRHVVLWWVNGIDRFGTTIRQLVHLTGNPGNYNYFYPVAKPQSPDSMYTNYQALLGRFTRTQRDQIITLSKGIAFNRKSTVNNCTVWLRDLLAAMVNAGLISQQQFQDLVTAIPLAQRQPEV